MHPFKKDSMVLCEKCTKSSVAKRLKESPVIDELVMCFGEVFRIIKNNEIIYQTKEQILYSQNYDDLKVTELNK